MTSPVTLQTPYYTADTGIVVGQGTVVSPSINHPTNNYDNGTPNTATTKIVTPMNIDASHNIPHGEQQPNACKDSFWAVLFYLHLIAIAFVTIQYAPTMASDMASEYAGRERRLVTQFNTIYHYLMFLPSFSPSSSIDSSSIDSFSEYDDNHNHNDHRYLEEGEDNEAFDFDGLTMNTIYIILGISGTAGFLISTVAMSLMMIIPSAMIKVALLFNVCVTTGLVVFAIVVQAWPMVVMSGIGLLFTIYYTYIVWKRIPFAASTLVTAITAIKSNMGLAFFAYNNLVLTFLWSVWWSLASVATSYVVGDCDAEMYCESEINGWFIFAFLISFFWTCQVIKNVVHCTVAGTVGTWWFIPGEAKSCCSSAVRNSYWRSITTSFGPICFGSLIVAIIQATREIVNSMRTEENSLLLCLIDCLLSFLEYLAEQFSKWAYIYVGLYGYGFVEASVNVLALFQARGWTSIIADMLIDTVLLMVSICVGVITGIIGAVVGGVMLQQGGAVMGGAFLVGMIIGFVLCSTLFSLVSSAVNTVIVCFAEAPAEFHHNHPQLSQQMLVAWRDAYPTEFGY